MPGTRVKAAGIEKEFQNNELLEWPLLPAQPPAVPAAGSKRTVSSSDKTEAGTSLSFAQEHLWAQEQRDAGGQAPTTHGTFSLCAPVDPAVIRRTLQELIHRHEMLRATFRSRNEVPVQVILPQLSVEPLMFDLRQEEETQQRSSATRVLASPEYQRFDVQAGPLFRVLVFQFTESWAEFHIILHSLIADSRSVWIFASDFLHIYRALIQGAETELRSSPSPFIDFAAWQRGRLRGAVLRDLSLYWKDRWNGVPALLEIPSDRPRPLTPEREFGCHFFDWHGESTEANTLAKNSAFDQFLLLLSSINILLFRYSHQKSSVVGIPVAHREQENFQEVIGPFSSFVAVITDLSPEMTAHAAIHGVRAALLDSYAHREMVFEKLLEKMPGKLTPDAHSFFQTTLAYHDRRSPAEGRQSLPPARAIAPSGNPQINIDHPANNHSEPDMALDFICDDAGLHATLRYKSAIFDEATIVRMSGHFRRVLSQCIAQPDLPISRVELMPPSEREQVLRMWNQTSAPLPKECRVHKIFEAQAALTPDLPATVQGNRSLSYRELNSLANRLAHYLIEQGTCTESVVGICMDSSIEMIIAIFGVLKCGGVYLPLDPHYPDERLNFMLEQAGATLLITHPQQADRVARLARKQTIVLTGDSTLNACSDENPRIPHWAENACYVMYTSGSTGRPKGVVVTHVGLANFIAALKPVFNTGPGRRFSQFASFSFDASVREIFECLLNGATLFLERREAIMPGEPLARFLRENRITDASLPPSVIQHLPEDELPDLTTITVGGEACNAAVADRFGKPGRRLFNGYGPTEITIISSFGYCKAFHGKPTIGRPFTNYEYYVVNRWFEPCVIGQPGELLIGGIGLARGYFGQQDLTAERFVPDPFSGKSGAQLYRTGDLVRWLPTGEVDYLGRVDTQVKIRGFRIELEEIEVVLSQHPGISQCTVISHSLPTGDHQLVAYVVYGKEPISKSDLQSFLRDKLPDYMVPDVMIPLKTIPITRAGKVDRKALPSPAESLKKTEFVPPAGDLEASVAQAWKEVLGLESVSMDDNFFELGGSSVRAVLLTVRLQEITAVKIDPAMLHRAPTVRALCQELDAARPVHSVANSCGAP